MKYLLVTEELICIHSFGDSLRTIIIWLPKEQRNMNAFYYLGRIKHKGINIAEDYTVVMHYQVCNREPTNTIKRSTFNKQSQSNGEYKILSCTDGDSSDHSKVQYLKT